ncbi:MAG: hypothetical protein HY527_15640 [Betaproteobacteria bacterium]|nr:hypothetical protein [Acidobacteriota bacterium]MBI4206453.1 hypothetical protein [Betaproteobacteria bacterium]
MKQTGPLLITAAGGFVLIVAYFIPFAQNWGELAAIWFDILAAVAFILGGGNLLKTHLKRISDRARGWGYSGVVVVSFLATLFVGLVKVGVNPSAQFPDFAWSGQYRQMGSAFWYLFQYAFTPLTATMFSLLAFYIASAAFRAFRAKNVEAVLLLGTAFIILLGRTFAGVALTSWIDPDVWAGFAYFTGLRLENLTVYIMSVFNTAGNRAIMIGIALGIVATSLKVLLGIDRSYLGKD